MLAVGRKAPVSRRVLVTAILAALTLWCLWLSGRSELRPSVSWEGRPGQSLEARLLA
jgi:hypothetical protein